MIDLRKVLSCADAADELGLTPDAVRRYCQRGTLRGYKLGNEWMLTREEVTRYRKERLGRVGRPSSEY